MNKLRVLEQVVIDFSKKCFSLASVSITTKKNHKMDKDGEKYVGEFRNDERVNGTYYFANGDRCQFYINFFFATVNGNTDIYRYTGSVDYSLKIIWNKWPMLTNFLLP